MKQFVTDYVKECAQCQANKANTHKTRPPLYPIKPQNTYPFKTIVSRLRQFARTIFSFACYPSLCTILRPQSTTPGIACDSKSLIADWLGPLVQPRFPVRYLADSHAWPSPLWAYNAFSYVLFLSFRLASSVFHSIPLYSIPFYHAFDLIHFYSILFDSLRLVFLLFFTTLRLARDLRVLLYINHYTI